jgi:hypothetical protein
LAQIVAARRRGREEELTTDFTDEHRLEEILKIRKTREDGHGMPCPYKR